MLFSIAIFSHEAWGLPEAPDMVTFSKKMLIGGYYYKDALAVNEVWAAGRSVGRSNNYFVF